MNRVVARFTDGRLVKGFTNDFSSDKPLFHVSLEGAALNSKAVELRTPDLKALFFVKDFKGNSSHIEHNEFAPSRRPLGRKIRVVFKDNEEMVGSTQGYQAGRVGFFLIPADPTSNIERCYVLSSATKNITFI